MIFLYIALAGLVLLLGGGIAVANWLAQPITRESDTKGG